MRPTFQTVFDLTQRPDLIHSAYWFIAIFALAGVILVTLAWLAVRRRWRWRRSLPIFTAAWVAICTYCIAADIRDKSAIRDAVVAGKVQVAEGCLDYFHPGSPHGTKTAAGDEEWSVDGRVFNYGAGDVGPAFHSVATAGGPIRADSRTRVSFVVSPAFGRREIVKLELVPHACPMARKAEAFDQP